MASRFLLGVLRPRRPAWQSRGGGKDRREVALLLSLGDHVVMKKCALSSLSLSSSSSLSSPFLQPQRTLATGGRREGGGRLGRRKFQPLPPLSSRTGKDKAKKGNEDVLVFQEEDTEDLAAFLEEYDALEKQGNDPPGGGGGGGGGGAPPLMVVEEYKVEEGDDGDLRMVLHNAHSPASEDSVKQLLQKAKEAGAMTEDDWFEFLRRSGMQRSMASSRPREMADHADEGKVSPPPLRRGRQTRKGPPKFVDRIAVAVSAGKGGKGCISFETVGNAKGGAAKRPSGGHGGQGGDVIFVADPRVQSLEMDRHHFHGKDGETGDSNNKRGARGRHTVVRVPCGTVVKEVVRNEEGLYERIEVCDLDEPMSYYMAAAGGKPGLGNSIQAGRARKSSSASGNFRAPGHQGEQRYYELELKTIADVGLVGYPNAGKSTLLGSLSRAQPKVANYPFTTLHPTVGRVEFTDAASLTVADLPGLIEGAHANKGLGHEFLRHIERTKVLLYVLDGVGRQEIAFENLVTDGSVVNEAPAEVLRKLKNELERYCPGLSRRPSLVWLNKADLNAEWVKEAKAAVEAVLKEDEEEVEEGSIEGRHKKNSALVPILWGSARTGDRLGDLAYELRHAVERTSRQGEDDVAQGTSGSNGGGSSSIGGGGEGRTRRHGGGGGSSVMGTSLASATTHQMQTQLAYTFAQALDAAHVHNNDWAEAVHAATESNLLSRRYMAGLEVSRRHAYWFAHAMTLAHQEQLLKKETGTVDT